MIQPITVTAAFSFVDSPHLFITGSTKTSFGTIQSYIYQRNKAYTGSFIDPLFDDSKEYSDYTHAYSEPAHYLKSVQGQAQKQLGIWNWSPLASEAI